MKDTIISLGLVAALVALMLITIGLKGNFSLAASDYVVPVAGGLLAIAIIIDGFRTRHKAEAKPRLPKTSVIKSRA